MAWRLAAWILSAVVFVAHFSYEYFGQRNSPRVIAWHVSLAVALGGLGLAIAASIHNRHILTLAVLVWPIVVGAPAYLVALVAAAGLMWARRNVDGDSLVKRDQ